MNRPRSSLSAADSHAIPRLSGTPGTEVADHDDVIQEGRLTPCHGLDRRANDDTSSDRRADASSCWAKQSSDYARPGMGQV